MPWGEELRRWSQAHPEYSRDQILALASCIAEANSVKRKERNALVAVIADDLSAALR